MRKRTGIIIAAAGSGNRMGSGIPKQFRELGGKPLLFWSLQTFSKHPQVDEIVIVTSEPWQEYCQREIVEKYGINKVAAIVPGGRERQESVQKGLQALSPETEVILIHDGARPFVSAALVGRIITQTFEKQACTAAVSVKDTIKQCENGIFTATPDRSLLYAVQTPQGFSRGLLERAHREASSQNFQGTDDTVLVEKLGQKVYLVEGEYNNIKITTTEDLVAGAAILQAIREAERPSMPVLPRVGMGYDVHAFCEGRPLILGGIEIPHSKGLLGHSDADVLVHAIMDALLGACALGDIGRHFPDTDPAYKGISSLRLLAEVGALLRREGYEVGNLDCVVIAQKPKIAPYIEAMTKAVAAVLKVSPQQINIKGTTTEKLGFTGREEGIASQAVVTVYKSIEE